MVTFQKRNPLPADEQSAGRGFWLCFYFLLASGHGYLPIFMPCQAPASVTCHAMVHLRTAHASGNLQGGRRRASSFAALISATPSSERARAVGPAQCRRGSLGKTSHQHSGNQPCAFPAEASGFDGVERRQRSRCHTPSVCRGAQHYDGR